MMTIDLNPRLEAGYLHVDMSGEFSLDEAKRTFVQILKGVAQYKVTKVLIDGRKVTGEVKIHERFDHGQFAAEMFREFVKHGVPPETKFARVLNYPVLDKNRLGQIVAQNRGMNIKVTDSLAEACEWLGIVPPAAEPGSPEFPRRRDAEVAPES